MALVNGDKRMGTKSEELRSILVHKSSQSDFIYIYTFLALSPGDYIT